MKKIITLLLFLFIGIAHAQQYIIVEKLQYEVRLEGEVVSVFNTLNEATNYVEDITNTDTYFLDFQEWGIVEGVVSDAVAKNNRIKMNEAIIYAYSNSFTKFDFGKLYAFFDNRATAFGNTAHREAIQLQSNTEYILNDDTRLFVQPNELPAYAILSARKKENIIITGGFLYGDKFQHVYTKGIDYKMHDSGYGIYFRGVRNSIVRGVTMTNFTGDGMAFHGIGRRNADGSVPLGEEDSFCDNLLITGNTFNSNRRNNLSAIDGTNIIIENNKFLKAGDSDSPAQGSQIENYSWRGVIPSNGIDFEAWRQYDENGAYHTQFLDNIIVRNNTFRGSRKADVNLYTCSNIQVYGNSFDSSVSGKAFNNCSIYNNEFINNPTYRHQTAITIKNWIRSGTGIDENTGNKVYGNTIENYDFGIRFGATDGECFDNTIINGLNGIYLTEGGNNKFYNNTIKSNLEKSKGYTSFAGGITQTNITVINEVIDVKQYGLYLRKITGKGFGVVFDDCNIISGSYGAYFNTSSYITVKDSRVENIKKVKSTDITLINNN